MKDLKVPLFVILTLFLGLFLYTKLAGPIPFFVNSVSTAKTNLFTVSGVGKATEVPNTALISIGVTKTASNVLDAQNQTNTVANKIVDDLKALGVEEKNIKTTNYSVNPDYDYSNGKQTIKGYTVTQNLEVKIKPIDKANQAIDKVTSDGANLVGGITFVLDDQTQKDLENKARVEAVKNAKEKAQNLANAAGISLGKILDIQEGISQSPMPVGRGGALALDKSNAPTELTPGENTVQITITLSYETR